MSTNKKLVIVESPAKAKTINKILGKDYIVAASVGHIIDLPKTKFGVDIENEFRPQYVTIKGKGKIINELKHEASKVDEVILATDPDREGEAIAYHIAKSLHLANKKISRIEFNEITQVAVLNAIKHPRKIDKSRVNAQQARRVMDRIVGYQVSPFLWATIYRGLSAGRVQSVALRLISEREKEIDEFTSIEYWNIDAILETKDKESFKARLFKIDQNTLDNNKYRIANKQEADNHKKVLENEIYQISNIDRKTIKRIPQSPFITSTLQQEASRRFRMTTSRIMSVAQQLYEGINLGEKGNVGLITYMRTDSTRVSNESISNVRDYISKSYGVTYLPAKPNVYGRKSAQDAHEAIRPTYVRTEFEPKKLKKYLTKDQYQIYELIWRRFVASQMKAAQVDKTIVYVQAGKYLFKSEGEVITFRGYLVVYGLLEDQESIANENGGFEHIPKQLKEKDILNLKDLILQQKFTQPPPRYTESTLVKTLDKLDIGRPSTYAQIISTLFLRKYVERVNRSIKPTELGDTVVRLLVRHFPEIFNVKFTAEMEDNLDKIEQGLTNYLDTLNEFYIPFDESLQKVLNQKREIKQELLEKTELKCEICGRTMVIRWGRNGRFYACSGYPKCKNTKPIEEAIEREVEEKCEICGSDMVVKRGRFGEFLACSNYPKCKNTKPISTGVLCPEKDCDGIIVQRQSKRSKIFYSCSNYPKCKFAIWDKPINLICSECSYPLMLEKSSQAKGFYYQCPRCKHKTFQN